jgi:putative transposase
VVFLDAIHVKIRDGKVANRPIYIALAVTVEGTRDILGLWAGDGGEGAKFWLQVLTELKNRGVADVCMVVCDGLKGLPDAIEATWPLAVTQTCVIHLLRASFRYAGRQHWDPIAKALRPVYTAPTESAARERFTEFTDAWGAKHPALERGVARVRAVPRVRHRDPHRRVLHQRDRVSQRPHPPCRTRPGHFPNDTAALKCVYLAIMSLDPTGQGRRRWTIRWKPALNAFDMTFDGRLSAARK